MELLETVKRAQNGDKQAFGELYDKFADQLYRFIQIKVNNNQQAEDLLQEVFIKAWSHLNSLDLENLNFSAWLYKIAQNCLLDHYRRMYRRPTALELKEEFDKPTQESPEHAIDLKNDLEIVKRALKQLPANYKIILELRFIQDFTLQETADILKKNNVTIRVAQYRALAKLRKIIGKKL